MKKINNKSLMYILISIVSILALVIIIPTYSMTNYKVLETFPNTIDFTDTTNLVAGNFNNDKTINPNDDYISYKAYLKPITPSLRVITSNENIRLIIKSYDESYKYIATTDLGNGDYYTKETNATYLLISLYKSDNLGNAVDLTYNTLLTELQVKQLTIESISDINSDELTKRAAESLSYLTENTFLNAANFRSGYYNGGYYTGGVYTASDKQACSRNLYKVVPNQKYYISANDSRYKIQINVFDLNGHWKWDNWDWKGGVGQVEFTAPNDSVIIGVDISTVNNSNVTAYQLVNNKNFKLSFNTNKYLYERTPTTDNIPSINDATTWKLGGYGYTYNDYYYEDDIYCTKTFIKKVDLNDTYVFKTNNENYQLKVFEYNEAKELVSSTLLKDERTFKFNESTTYYAYEIINAKKLTDEGYLDFLEAINQGLDISLTKYEKYVYNTKMNDITSEELLSKLTTGWNLGNSLDSAAFSYDESTAYFQSETYWGNPYVTENLIKHIKSLGFNNIRIPVTWANNVYQDENGNYVIRKEYLSRVQDVINYAIKNDMYVVMNTHFDAGQSKAPISVGAEDATFDKTKTYTKEIWTQIADYFKNYDEHLMFESYNEVDNRVKGRVCSNLAGKQMNEINQIFVDAVRSTGGNNGKRVLMVQTFLSITDQATLDSFVTPTDTVDNKIIIQVHTYPNAWDEQIEDELNAIDELKERVHLPVVVGEFGTTGSFKPSSYRYISVSNFIARAKKHNILVYVWDNGSSYSFVNRKDFAKDDKKMLDVIFNPVEYTTGDKTVVNNFDLFNYKTLNQSTGTYEEDKYWGTISTKDIPVDNTKEYALVELNDKHEASNHLIHYIFFYDADGNFLKQESYNNTYPGGKWALLVIPSNAKTMRIGINSSFSATTQSQYQSFIESGNLVLRYKYIDLDIDRTLLDEPLKSSETMLSSMDQFDYMRLVTSDGTITSDIYWGSITTNYLPINDGDTLFNYRWTARLSGSDIAVHYICFYDADHKYIANSSINHSESYGMNSASLSVPTGAKYVKIGLNSTSGAHKYRDYNMIFKTGDTTLIYSSSKE